MTWNIKQQNQNARLNSDVTTASSTLASIPGLAVTLAANETWDFWGGLKLGCNGTGGVQITVSTPAGATFMAAIQGMANSISAYRSNVVTASDGTGPTLNDVVATSGWCNIEGSIANGATPGLLQLRGKSVVNGQTSSIYTGSYLSASRV
jgi:hypothetical protein